jgi:hypothetical protein
MVSRTAVPIRGSVRPELSEESDMFITDAPKPPEWLHSKKCLAEAMISAVQNARDAEDFSALEFTLWAQDGGALADAHEYLNSGLQTCICPPDYIGG